MKIRLSLPAISWMLCTSSAFTQSSVDSPAAAASRQPPFEIRQPGGAENPKENLTTFDYQQAELQWLGGRWQLRAGPALLKDFGRQETDAREALRIIRELKLTQFGTVGSPRPLLEYWLSNGLAPSNSIPGLRTNSFERENLRVEQVQGQWCVRQARQVLFSFGYHEDEARQALAIIRKYGFDHVGYLGRPAPVMIFFLAGNGQASQIAMQGKPATQPHMVIQNSPFTRQILHKSEKEQGTDGSASFGRPNPNDLAAFPSVRQLGSPILGAPAARSTEDRVAVDWRHVQLRQDGEDWKLVYGNYTLADLGFSESDARVALAVVQHYRFTEHCLIGGPGVLFSYFLVNGQAPRGLCFGAHNTPFRPEALAVQKQGEDWVLAEGSKLIWHFGERGQEAREALQAIRRYHFDTMCQIGPSRSPLTFFIRTR